jgi:hypothetical protein
MTKTKDAEYIEFYDHKRYSDWNLLIRICRAPNALRLLSFLSVEEYRSAKLLWFKQCQSAHYSAEIKALESEVRSLPRLSHLIPLLPFLQDGLLRVGGRLDRALIPYDARHQIILPPNDHITMLILLDVSCPYVSYWPNCHYSPISANVFSS